MAPAPLILASRSPRRRRLLAILGLPFTVVPAEADESRVAGATARRLAANAAREKCLDVVARVSREAVVLAADTVVCLGEKGKTVLGKPSSPEEARHMLRLLSGRTHHVVTAVAVARGPGELREDVEDTAVAFHRLSATDIAEYVATGEPLDKAGAYGIQGRGRRLVRSIRGDLSNVIGLPLARVVRLLRPYYPDAPLPGPPDLAVRVERFFGRAGS